MPECHKIRAKALASGVCTTFVKEELSPTVEVEEKVVRDVSTSEQQELLEKIIEANQITMRVVRCIPRQLTQWWCKGVTVTILDWLNAKTTKRTLRAIERWSKLKAVVIRPLRSGKKRRTRGTPTEWQINMERWVEGDWEAVWEEACDLEKRRATIGGKKTNGTNHKELIR